uniref:Biotin-protein ligase N-terminal domain-containing protein n=2 Tax=Arion vulgaris TaxID=1028688 RepID=A0A0B7BAM6_9EUPU
MDGGGFFKPYKQSVIDQTVGAVDKSDTETNMVKSELHLNESPSDRDYQPASCDLDVLGPRRRSLVVDTLGKYSSLVETDSTAIVKCKVGDGMVILSGVHVEFPAQLLLQENVYLKPWLPQFLRSEDTRLFVFKDILAQLGVQV